MRKINWHAILENEIARARKALFSWGKHDCALFACNCVHAITGIDPAAPFRHGYDSEEGACEALKAFAGGGLNETAEKIARDLGCPEIPPKLAQRGDVVLCNLPTGKTLGIIGMNGREALVAGKEGLISVPLKRVLRAWRVE